MRLAVIVHAPEIIPAGHGSERTVEGQNFKAAAGKVEVANNLRAEERDDVGADRELESGENFFGDRRAAEHVTALEHEDLLPRAREICGVSEAIVASADHDGVVGLRHKGLAASNEQ